MVGLVSVGGSAAAQQSPVVFVVVQKKRAFTLSSAQPGTAEAFYEADLGANVTGFVSELAVDVGDRVKAGQVLARLAVPELVARTDLTDGQKRKFLADNARRLFTRLG